MTVQIDYNHRRWQLSGRRPSLKRLFQDHRVHIPGCVVAVDKDGSRAQVADGICGSGEGQGTAKDLVARPDTQQLETQVNGGGAAGQTNGGLPHQTGEVGFERCQIRANGRDPVL